jgi:hypothetical protein
MAGRFGVCLLVLMLAPGCSGAGHKRVLLPPVSAGPQRVVAAYVTALSDHDLHTARALLTRAHARDVEGEEDSWFRNVRSITHLHVNRPWIDQKSTHAVVGVRFVLDQYKVESMENGPTVWGYMLVRKSPKNRWLIEDEGLG